MNSGAARNIKPRHGSLKRKKGINGSAASAPMAEISPKAGLEKTYKVRKVKKIKKSSSQAAVVKISPRQMDFSLLFVVLMLVMFGIVMVFSASYYAALTKEAFQDMYYFLKRQVLWSVSGLCGMLFMANFDYRRLKKLAPMIYSVSLILLVLVLFIGDEINGAKRWLGIGPFGVQPSEVAKIAVIILLASLISKNRERLNTFKGFLQLFMFVVMPVVLIAIENLSTAIVVTFIGVALLFVASPKIWYFIVMAAPVLGGGVVAVIGFEEFAYRLGRIKVWLDPFSDPIDLGFQTVQSLYAVASGGLFGLGLGQSRQKLGFIPEAYNDIIFSIVCEELGFVGAAALLALFMALIYKGIKIAIGAPDLFGSLVATGIICMVGVQVLINIAVITNTIPVTGMPLPFISYGGSSLLLMMGCMGILLNISRFVRN